MPLDRVSALWPGHQPQRVAGFLQPQSAGWVGLQHRARPRQSPLTDSQSLRRLSSPQRSGGHEQQPDQLRGILLGPVVPDQIVRDVSSPMRMNRRTGGNDRPHRSA